MVSRQRILSRSRDDLNMEQQAYPEEDTDVWYNTDLLLKDHMHEVLKKWEQIDDEIWAKVIVMEKNRRVAKAYVRSPILTINGSDIGFDGYRIGLSGFENPLRDSKTEEIITRHVGSGIKVRMDDDGNILVKRVSKANVYVKTTGEENAISNEVLKASNLALEFEKPAKVFDIKKFEHNVNTELRRAYVNRSKLENQCIIAISFAKPGTNNLLQCASWVMIINIVAMDMLRTKLPTGLYVKLMPSIKNRPRLPVPEEDPYSITGGGSGTSSGGSSKEKSSKDKPPKLPPRENGVSTKPPFKSDYDQVEESMFRRFRLSLKNNKEKDKKADDPYYCGLRARIPNFAKSKSKDRVDLNRLQYPAPPIPGPQPMHPGTMFHSRSFDSGMAKMTHDERRPYGRIAWGCSGGFLLPQHHDDSQWENYWVS